jgi:hypothetical protein
MIRKKEQDIAIRLNNFMVYKNVIIYLGYS